MPQVVTRAAVPILAVLFLAATPGRAAPGDHGAPVPRCAGTPVPRCAGAPGRSSARSLVRVPADSVRQLSVAIVLATNSFY